MKVSDKYDFLDMILIEIEYMAADLAYLKSLLGESPSKSYVEALRPKLAEAARIVQNAIGNEGSVE